MAQMDVEVTYYDQAAKLPLIVVLDNGPSLLEWDWMMNLTL